MPVPAFLRRCLAVLGFALAVAARAADEPAPHPGAVGDSGHLWLVAPAPKAADGWRILHRDPIQKDELSSLPRGMAQPLALQGGAPAICARGGVFYAAFPQEDGAIRLAEWRLGEPSFESTRLVQRNLGTLPAGVKLLAMAAGNKHLWLVVEGVPAQFAKPAAAPAAALPDALTLALRLPPGALKPEPKPSEEAAKEQPKESAKEPAKEAAASPAPATERRQMLLRMDGSEARPVLASLPVSGQAWLASDGERLAQASDAHTLWRVRVDGRDALADPSPFTHLMWAGKTLFAAKLAAEHALQGGAWQGAMRAEWSERNPDHAAAPTLRGTCSLPLEPGAGYGVVEWEGRPALVRVAATFAAGQEAASIVPVDAGGASLPTVALREAPDAEAAREGLLLLQTAVTVAAISLMVWSWRQGPRRLPKLPRGLRRAGILRRTVAGLVDLGVAVGVVALIFHAPVRAIVHEWPLVGDPSGLADMRLGFIAGGLFIAHTALGEALTGRSLGKALVGLRVVGLDGQPAKPWRILVRGLLKWLELLSPALLALAVFSPFGQRLGDLAAGTVVVQDAPQEPG